MKNNNKEENIHSRFFETGEGLIVTPADPNRVISDREKLFDMIVQAVDDEDAMEQITYLFQKVVPR